MLVNEDDGLSFMRKLAFDGRFLRLYQLADGVPFAGREVVFSGTVEQAEVSEKTVSFRLRDRLVELQKDLQPTRYLGTTTSAGKGVEGTENDLKDRPKPLAFGRVFEVPLVQVNAFDGLWQGAQNAIASCEAVYSSGLTLTRVGAAQPDLASLMAVTLTQGQYAVMLSPFIVRIGGKVTGTITADYTEGATAAQRTTAQLVRRILLFAGKVEGVDFLPADIAAFDTVAPAEQGVWCAPEDMQIQAPLYRLLAGVGGFLTTDRLGRFRFGQFRAPTGTPRAIFTEIEILDDGQAIETLATSDEGNGVPTSKVTVTHTQLWQTQDGSAVNGAVDDARRAYLKTATRSAVAEDASVKVRHLLASEITFASLLTNSTDATAEADRQLDLRKVRRDFIQIKVPSAAAVGIDLGDTVMVRVPLLGLDDGKLFVVTRMIEELDSEDDGEIEAVTLELWG
ncbi:hypothetical protein SAMN05192530_103450 [Aureimonas jatrophae]|uniref:Phage tail protein n=1 Tax=Aureimonas jatrophae TaxID=1166073 RepID=A0A1H0H034_9HYPH|nr:hypothetical protein SAMN05192530_103450 [Aureimonas jatrophae]